jgi:hypothetical protein
VTCQESDFERKVDGGLADSGAVLAHETGHQLVSGLDGVATFIK